MGRSRAFRIVVVSLTSLLLLACDEPPAPGLAFAAGEEFDDGEWILFQEIEFQYSASGRLERSPSRKLDSNGAWFEDRLQTFTYEVGPSGERAVTGVDRQRFSFKDPVREIRTTYRYNAEGLVESVELVATSTAAPEVRGTQFTYEEGCAVSGEGQTADGHPARIEWRYDGDRLVEELYYLDGEVIARLEWDYDGGKVIEQRRFRKEATPTEVFERDYSSSSFVEEGYEVRGEERKYTGKAVVSRDPRLGSVTLEVFDREDLPLFRVRYDFAAEHTDNFFDVPWRPEPNEWERSRFYGPW